MAGDQNIESEIGIRFIRLKDPDLNEEPAQTGVVEMVGAASKEVMRAWAGL